MTATQHGFLTGKELRLRRSETTSKWILHRRVYPPLLVIFAIVTFIENVAVRFYRMGQIEKQAITPKRS